MARILLLTCLCLILHLTHTATAAVCDELAISLSNLDMRSTSFDTTLQDDGVAILQDTALAGQWYSTVDPRNTTLQYKMADNTEIPSVLRCGTYFPVYIRDTHPLLEDGQEATVSVCVVGFVSPCNEDWHITVRKCNGRYDYKLLSTRSDTAYCFEHERKKDPDFEPPAFDVLNAAEVATAMDYEVIPKQAGQTFANPYLTFSCKTKTENKYYYRVYWYVNNELFRVTAPVRGGSLDSTNLLEQNLLDNGYTQLGITMKCGVTASNSENGLSTQQKYSSGFFAGIKVHHAASKLSLQKGEVGHVVLENTVPIGCRQILDRPTSQCGLEVEMFDPNTKYDCEETTLAALDSQGLCGVYMNATFTYDDYINGTNSEHQFFNSTMKIRTKNDAVIDGTSKTFTLQLKTYGTHTIWNNYRIADIIVQVHDNQPWAGRVCSSHLDPHVTTSDGVPFENQQLGTFVLYRNKVYPIEVQETTKACRGNHIFCPCAVIVRAGADLFEFDICHGIVRYEFLQCDDNILDVREVKKNKFTIRTPIGTTIQIRVAKWNHGYYLNIDITMSPKDFGNVEGLCGQFNGNPADDLQYFGVNKRWKIPADIIGCAPKCRNFKRFHPKEFSRTWRASVASKDYSRPENQNQTPWPSYQTLCICENSIEGGEEGREEALCSASEFLTCKNTVSSRPSGTKKECAIKRRKRSIKSLEKEREVREQRGRATVHTIEERSTDDSNYTIADGIKECLGFLERQDTYTKYETNLPESSAEATFTADCASDYELVGPEGGLMEVHFDILMTRKVIDIDRNKTIEAEDLEILNEFKTVAGCSYNCSGNGECTEDGCNCNDGFGGSFCSVNKAAPLDITYMEGNGTCDLESDACDNYNVQADDILPSFMCRIKETQISTRGVFGTSTTYDKPGERNTMFDGYCDTHPPAARKRRAPASGEEEVSFVTVFAISISNDGVTYGSPGSVYVFDSQCQDYTSTPDGDPVFSLKHGFCYIDGRCQAEGRTQAMDTCYSCSPKTDPYSWTKSCTATYTPGSKDKKTAIIIGSSVAAGVLMLAVIASLTCFLIKRVNKRKCVSSPDLQRDACERPIKEPCNWMKGQGTIANAKTGPNAPASDRSTVSLDFVTDFRKK